MAALENFGIVPAPPRIGARIRELRKSYNLKQAELAGQIGILQSDLSRIEKGEYRVSLDVLFKILHVFELSIGEFFEEILAQGMTVEDLGLIKKVRGLTPEGRDEVADFIEFRLRKEAARKGARFVVHEEVEEKEGGSE